ncbi:MAG TPA: aldehyde dehydrogenase family protein [Ilumatobacteraceae bacterium]|nr:aldehyde dehydrogenase family protein [Ilumatobacteraceae bacterium]
MTARPEIAPLSRLFEGQEIPFGGDRVVRVDADLAERFAPGDRLVVVQATGALVHIPAGIHALVDHEITLAVAGFAALAETSDEAISDFFDRFAAALADDAVFAPIAAANAADVERAAGAGRSTTRLSLDDKMRADMIAGLLVWRDSPSRRGGTIQRVEHGQWSVEANRAPLGVVGFVFEGRPNVFADACGVVRTGNAVVFRIGSDALGTARAIVEQALTPSLRAAGLPEGVVRLIDSPTHAAGHALFTDPRLALAVARGSGPVVAELGAVASQSGTPVSLHGSGGAWMVASANADPEVLRAVVTTSLDRKVCNTLSVCAIVRSGAANLVPAFLAGLDDAAAERGVSARLHVVAGSEDVVSNGRFEDAATLIDVDGLAVEWEWEQSPEVTLVIVESVEEAADLCNRYSPHFVASLISDDVAEHDRFYASIDAPFVGNGFTRWVDGQYALDAPELGLSNWQAGRTLGRGAILSGDSVHTVRYRAVVTDHSVRR